MRRRETATLAAALALSSLAMACGDEPPPEGPAAQGQPPPAAEAEPRDPEPGGENDEAQSGRDGESSSGSGHGGEDAGGGDGQDGGSYDPGRPDGPGNDRPPPAGSAAERFERECPHGPESCD